MLKTHVPLKIQSTQPEPAQMIELNTELIELSEEDLGAIVGAGMPDNHNETLIGVADATQSKSTQLIELSEEDLEAIVGGAGNGGGGTSCTPDDCGENHNETIISVADAAQTESNQIIELTEEDLEAIFGGMGGGGDRQCTPWTCGTNHNETLIHTQDSTQSQETEPIELSVEDLEAIAGGIDCPPDHCGVNHNEMLVNTNSTQSQSTQIIYLSGEDLEAIAGGFRGGTTCPEEECGVNHNETLVDIKESAPIQSIQIIELSEEDLDAIVGGIGNGGGGNGCTPDDCGENHNETLIDIKESTQTESTQIIYLSEEDLEAIVGGMGGGGSYRQCPPWTCGTNHNETLIHTQDSTQSQETKPIELSVEDLEAIAGAGGSECPRWTCGGNHNETLVDIKESTQAQSTQIIELGVKDLAAIVGGIGGGGGGSGCTPDDCGENHNETLVDIKESAPTQSTQIIYLSGEDLAAIVGNGIEASPEEYGI
ncbi:MAG: hypothetical protein AAF215_19810 [Cyanobacteria bacterium P01_A01_bin.123]